MENFDQVVKKLKAMDKSKRKDLLSELSSDPKTMEQVNSLLKNPDIQKKLKDLLK